jgi:hypothetical protein
MVRRAVPETVHLVDNTELLAAAPVSVRKVLAITDPIERGRACLAERDRLRAIAKALTAEIGKSLFQLKESDGLSQNDLSVEFGVVGNLGRVWQLLREGQQADTTEILAAGLPVSTRRAVDLANPRERIPRLAAERDSLNAYAVALAQEVGKLVIDLLAEPDTTQSALARALGFASHSRLGQLMTLAEVKA